MARYIKKGIKDPRFQYPNRYILSQIVGTQYDIIPYKGTKGVADAQPINEANMADIENALVNIDTDLAFIEADYINAAEHALKQNISEPTLTTTNKTIPGSINELVSLKQDKTDSNLNTTDKTVVGAINEVKSEGEYHDLLQDDAIAIVNNKINALPMNGSLKNIRTSTVGIPTAFTNIDMFNTKQTVTNYQPLSLDYKGASSPHIILMKTIGDYVFDFSIEATHTNGTDTTVTVEAWVDGVLYDTATRTLVGGTNQISGLTGFFQYSKGSDTVPSEIYFRFKASQGNTSANKAMINTNLQGNSATTSFTDTDHVTGIGLNESTYNGQTTSFIINDLKNDVNQMVKSVDGNLPDGEGNVLSQKRFVNLTELGYDNEAIAAFEDLNTLIYDICLRCENIYGAYTPVEVEDFSNPEFFSNIYDMFEARINNDPLWKPINWNHCVFTVRMTQPNVIGGGLVEVRFSSPTEYNNYFETTFHPNSLTLIPFTKGNDLTQNVHNTETSMLSDNLIGYDDTIHATSVLQEILIDIYNKVHGRISNGRPFEVSMLIGANVNFCPNLHKELQNYIQAEYGQGFLEGTLMFKMESVTTAGSTHKDHRNSTKVSVWSVSEYYEFMFEDDNWTSQVVRDREGNPSCRLVTLWEGNTSTGTIPLTGNLYEFNYLIINTSYWGGMMTDVEWNKQHYHIHGGILKGTTTLTMDIAFSNNGTTGIGLFADATNYACTVNPTTDSSSPVNLLKIQGGYR